LCLPVAGLFSVMSAGGRCHGLLSVVPAGVENMLIPDMPYKFILIDYSESFMLF
jgi:hypothetical protein